MKRFRNIIWGLIFIVIGLIFGGNALGIMNIDLFFDGYDSTIGEEINNRIVQLLDQHLFHDPDDGAIRIYLDNEVQVPTDEENISHWNLTFTLITWRRSFIAARSEWDL